MPLSVLVCVYAHVCEQLEDVKVVKLQQGCFRQNSGPEGSRAITHNSPALIGCIQLLYWKLSSFCCLQVAITSHLPFSSYCFATHVCMLTHRHTDSCSFTYMTHIHFCDREAFSYMLSLKYLIKIHLKWGET